MEINETLNIALQGTLLLGATYSATQWLKTAINAGGHATRFLSLAVGAVIALAFSQIGLVPGVAPEDWRAALAVGASAGGLAGGIHDVGKSVREGGVPDESQAARLVDDVTKEDAPPIWKRDS